ncbi:CDT1-like protein a, chloroplastic [Solanum dulcamara]|uniref:CDT1-like protein a, chloroplastic n=1 Tax=Solanum dulcamara TaxID=45834 RepID=UPI0024858840|nr:CDT1-like protein a, chloroplastic [Solanum dulcamara]
MKVHGPGPFSRLRKNSRQIRRGNVDTSASTSVFPAIGANSNLAWLTRHPPPQLSRQKNATIYSTPTPTLTPDLVSLLLPSIALCNFSSILLKQFSVLIQSMESTEASLLNTFKSKKKLQIGSDPDVSGAPSLDPWSSKTPEKTIVPPRRTRNRNAAFSLKDIRQAAQKLRKPDPTRPNSQTDTSLSSVKPQMASSSSSECSVVKPKKPVNPVKLPEKYKLLEEFFGGLVSSIRLLQLKGSSTTFTNIRAKVECLADRRFTYNHLAQLKFLLPEAIEIKKMLVFDERTTCMKPDLHITLNANGVEGDKKLKSSSGTEQLRTVFSSRILDFFKSHPEGDDIPEEVLPGAFGAAKPELLTNSSSPASAQLKEETPIGSLQKPPVAVSHLSQSFRRSFSHRASIGEAENAKQYPTVVAHTSIHQVSEPQVTNCPTNISKAADKIPKLLSTQTRTTRFSTRGVHSATLPPSPLPATPLKNTKSEDGSCLLSAESTPAKLASTPAKLMSSTPLLQPSKRCYMTPDGESTESPRKLVRRPPPSRSLTFNTPVKSSKVTEEISRSRESSTDDEIYDILPENLLQSIREKEQEALEEKDPAISQAKWRKKMISSLPNFFDTIYFLFQSINRSVITKEELMHKAISSHLAIADKREFEELLQLLQEIAPEWIHEKLSSSGDLLLCVNKVSNAESIRSRIAEAK